jgi:hypothetical protein
VTTLAFHRAALLLTGLVLSLAAPSLAAAQGFAVLASPPRFEGHAKPGETYRNIVELTNVADTGTRLNLKTADWTLDAAGSAVFSEALAADSCRPWVGIEARELQLAARGKRRFRFEVAVPADAPAGECRFALMVEGEPEASPGAVPVMVSGRLGIIVYVAIGDAAARLALVETRRAAIATAGGRDLPVLAIRNAGNAHGRLEGYLDGVDAQGTRFTFAPSSLPILAGETRDIVLTPVVDDEGTPIPAIRYPLTLKGRLNSGAQRLVIDTTVGQ